MPVIRRLLVAGMTPNRYPPPISVTTLVVGLVLVIGLVIWLLS